MAKVIGLIQEDQLDTVQGFQDELSPLSPQTAVFVTVCDVGEQYAQWFYLLHSSIFSAPNQRNAPYNILLYLEDHEDF